MVSSNRLVTFVLSVGLAVIMAAPLFGQGQQVQNSWKPPASNASAPGAPLAGSYGSGDITPIGPPPGVAPRQMPNFDGSGGLSADGGLSAVNPSQGPNRAEVAKGSGTLPNEQGQVWRNYNIRPYTSRFPAGGAAYPGGPANARPEQAIVDWILRETGYEAWHSEPFGILSATRDTLRVYHTPEMQNVVADIADRFVNAQASQYAFTLRIATVRNPNWRARALPYMTPIPVQSPGVQGWLLAKENARLLVSELVRRSDYREYNSPQQLIPNGHSIVISTMRPRTYIKGAVPTQLAWPGYQPEVGMLEEGFSLEFSPLLSFDLGSADAVVKLRLNQVEKMVPVQLDLQSVVAPNQRVQVDVPQMTAANLHERFRWPSDMVLLLSMGVVATPGVTNDNPLTEAMPIFKTPPRADALLLIECVGQAVPSADPSMIRAAVLPQHSFQGRY